MLYSKKCSRQRFLYVDVGLYDGTTVSLFPLSLLLLLSIFLQVGRMKKKIEREKIIVFFLYLVEKKSEKMKKVVCLNLLLYFCYIRTIFLIIYKKHCFLYYI
jgi:hypothetical protein